MSHAPAASESGRDSSPAGAPGRRPPRGGMKRELARKSIHLGTVLVPLVAWWLPPPITVAVLSIAVATAIVVEWARFQVRWVRYQFLRRTRTMLRPHERVRPAGATYLAVSYLVAMLVFPQPLAVVAMLYTGLGDATAALVGKRWGRHRTSWGKSWEGTAAAAAVNVGIGLVVPGVPTAAAFAGGLASALLEMAPLRIDDNLRTTLGGGAVGWLVWLLVAPIGPA